MLARQHRVPGYRTRQVLGGQVVASEPELMIRALPNQLSFGRAAVIVPARVLAKAVARNRLRRQLIALIEPHQITPGFDVVVLVRKIHAG